MKNVSRIDCKILTIRLGLTCMIFEVNGHYDVPTIWKETFCLHIKKKPDDSAFFSIAIEELSRSSKNEPEFKGET